MKLNRLLPGLSGGSIHSQKAHSAFNHTFTFFVSNGRYRSNLVAPEKRKDISLTLPVSQLTKKGRERE